MSIGQLVRRTLGNKWFPRVGRYYRSIFVDLNKVAKFMSKEIPENAHILDIGGGDGELLTHLMAMRHDISATMIDLSINIGNSIPAEFKNRVNLLPGTDIDKYLEMDLRKPNCIVISDVIHHIPPSDRMEFFKKLYDLIKKTKALILIKDVEPGHFISRLGYLSDRYISGDKNASLVSKAQVISMSKNIFGNIATKETGLIIEDNPNYLLSIMVG